MSILVKRIKSYVYATFALHEFMLNTYGDNYPREIVDIILNLSRVNFSMKCGVRDMFIMIDDKVFGMDELKPNKLVRLAFPSIKQIAHGNDHNVFLGNNGEVFVHGTSNEQQLPLIHQYGSYIHYAKQVSLPNVRAVFAGHDTTIVINSDNTSSSWGFNFDYKSYNGLVIHNENAYNPSSNTSLDLLLSGDVHDIDITIGTGYCFVKINSSFYAWGVNYCNALGLPLLWHTIPMKINYPYIKKFICGNACSFLITTTGDVYACGNNHMGKLGPLNDEDVLDLGCDYEKSKERYLEAKRLNKCPHFIELYERDTTFLNASFTKVNLPNKVAKIACGRDYTIFLTTTGELYSCGENKYGQLGIGNKISTSLTKINLEHVIDIECNGNHSIAITRTGAIYIWGQCLTYNFEWKFDSPKRVKILPPR